MRRLRIVYLIIRIWTNNPHLLMIRCLLFAFGSPVHFLIGTLARSRGLREAIICWPLSSHGHRIEIERFDIVPRDFMLRLESVSVKEGLVGLVISVAWLRLAYLRLMRCLNFVGCMHVLQRFLGILKRSASKFALIQFLPLGLWLLRQRLRAHLDLKLGIVVLIQVDLVPLRSSLEMLSNAAVEVQHILDSDLQLLALSQRVVCLYRNVAGGVWFSF